MVYLDNCATTSPKPDSVINAVSASLKKYSYNSGRGGYSEAVAAGSRVFSVRQSLADFLNCEPERVVFTQNCTLALNMAIKGLAVKGDHFIISSLEHNAVYRCVHSLYDEGLCTYDIAPFHFDADAQTREFEALIKPETKAIICTYSSNVFGCVLPVSKLGALAKKHGIKLVVDGAQGVGIFDIDMKRDNISVLCGAGHKGLYAPLAIGFLALNSDTELKPIIHGGTGSDSAKPYQPSFYPDRLEAGSLSNCLIDGLGAGLSFVKARGVDRIYSHELKLCEYIYDSLAYYYDAKLYTSYPKPNLSAPVLSFNIKDYSSEKTASLLAEKGIAVRGGLHCAVLAHKCFGTLDTGTVRLCPSVFTTEAQADFFIKSVKKL